MNKSNEKTLIIYGPTATGKTALAINLAKKYNGELISADSRQVYKGLDIGTGKVSFESKVEKHTSFWIVDGVKIHGFDLISPGSNFSVSDFLKFTQNSMIQITELKKLPIIVGGTGFYIKTLLEGLGTQGIPANNSLRKKLEKLNREELYKHLLKINPLKAKSMNESDRLNPPRLIRAIEISKSKSFSLPDTRYQPPTTNYQLIGLTASNTYLYELADESFNRRLNYGMIDEIKTLLKNNVSPPWLDNLGLEYRWLTRSILGQISENEALRKCRGELHSFIRRQKTWFKQFKNIKIYDISKPSWQKELKKEVKLWYNSR